MERKLGSFATMASVIIFLAAAITPKGTLGEVVCEKLGTKVCAFAVASSGQRCSLETHPHSKVGFQCTTSGIMASVHLKSHIENDDCINSCGLERGTVGISTDKFLEPEFSKKLCSKDCQFNCFNIVDLYSSLALAEGLYLPAVCKALGAGSRRKMAEIRSSGAVSGKQKNPGAASSLAVAQGSAEAPIPSFPASST